MLFEGGVEWCWWIDVVEDSLVNGEVHERNSEFLLNFGLFLDVRLDDSAHLLNCVHFGLLSDKNPVLKLLVEVDGTLSSVFELRKNPVPDLDESVPQDAFLNFDGLSHFFDVHALFDLSLLLDSSLLGVLLAALSFGISCALNLCDVWHDLLLESLCKESIQAWICVACNLIGIAALGHGLNCGWLFAIKANLNCRGCGCFRDQLLFDGMVVVLNYLDLNFELVYLCLV